MINHFTFNGTSTAQLGLIVSGVSIFGAGSRKVEKAGIPGRNGDLQIELGGFNNYTVRYTVSITKNFTTTAQQIREWLLESKGYCNLTDTYHPDEIRKACFNSDIEFTTSMLYKYGQASIQFDCLPERYLTTNTPITTTATADTTTDTTMSLSTVPTPINISLNGNTTQEGSSGKNLFGFIASDFTGAYGSANYVEITGLTEGTYYTCSSNAPTGYIWFGKNANSSQGTINFNRVYEGNPVTVQVDSMEKITVGILASDKTTALSYNTQIEQGSTATAYEPHISPTNPQPIHSVSGDNTVNVTSKNILSPFVIGIVLNTTNGSESASVWGATTDYINVDFSAHPSYYISGLSLTIHSYICAYNSQKQFLGRTPSTFRDGQSLTTSSFTGGTPQSTGDIAYLRVCYYQQGTDTDVSTANNYLSQLEIGNSKTTYEPYTRQSYPLYLPVENLLDSDLLLEASGWTETDGVYSGLNSTLHAKWGTNTDGIYNTFEQGQQYTFSLDLRQESTGFGALVIRFYYTDNTYDGKQIDGTIEWKRYTFTSTSTTKTLLKLILSYGNTLAIQLRNVQLEKGTNASQYNPYGNPSIELNKIGTYQDYIYKNGGKWYVHKAITKVDLGTLDSWNNYNDTFYANLVGAIIAPSSGIASILCTSYRATSMASVISKLEDKAIALNTGQSRCNVYDSSYNASTISNFINSVKGVWLYYPLATPTNTEITDTTLINQLNNIEKAYSYDGTTNILQVSNDNGFMLSVVSLHGSTFNSNYKGEPIITVNATGLIYLNGEVMEVLSAPVTINCQTMQCYNGGVNMNNEVRVNDFPEIKIGANEIGSSMALTITPNNWRH